MKTHLLKPLLFILATIILPGCVNENAPATVIEVPIKVDLLKKIVAFNDVNELVSTLSKNGIGALKPWDNPMDLGYGSLTDYYPIGTVKVEYGLTNNLAYYLEGTTNRATTLLIILNVNNPEEKGEGLVYLSKITQKTFQSLHLKMPSELSNSIRSGRVFKADQSDFITTFTLDQSKIETWKMLIKSK